MKKYIMATALALVLGTAAFSPAQAESGKVFGVESSKDTINPVVAPGAATKRATAGLELHCNPPGCGTQVGCIDLAVQGIVQGGIIADRVAPRIGADRYAPLVNPGFIDARSDLFGYYLANGKLPDTLNLDRLGTDKVGLLAIFENAKKIGDARKRFICGLQGFDVSKTDFTRSDFWSLGFTSADRLKKFTQGYINFVFGERFDPGFADHRSDFIFYSAKEQEMLRQDIFGLVK
ncbi:MAG: hypothetical protein K8R48_02220 [Alphaproteobacteria bacterium]|nr:hypothetical protein [Alphaproteobacteria bacterium]